jgi:acyl-coenzyme A thioesterase PaaI-like protein
MSWKSISNSQYSKLLGPLETKRENDKDYYRMIVTESHLNSGNFAHGGFLMSFLDNVMGNAAFKSFDNNACVTISMTTHFTQSASAGTNSSHNLLLKKEPKLFLL